MPVAPWTATDEGYLRAYEWARAPAGATPLPTEGSPVPVPLPPGLLERARAEGRTRS